MASAAAAGMPSKASLAAAAAGEALAFLLHPMGSTGQFPTSLIDEAWNVLSSKGQSLGAVNAQAAAGSMAQGGAGGGVSKRQMEERAQGSEALLKLAGLVGLTPVKQELLNLRDQVGGQGLVDQLSFIGKAGPNFHGIRCSWIYYICPVAGD